METIKKTIGAFFGMSPEETNIVIENTKRRVIPALSLISRILFVLGFVYCLALYTIAGIFLFVLGYYIVELERRVDELERRLKNDPYGYQ